MTIEELRFYIEQEMQIKPKELKTDGLSDRQIAINLIAWKEKNKSLSKVLKKLERISDNPETEQAQEKQNYE